MRQEVRRGLVHYGTDLLPDRRRSRNLKVLGQSGAEGSDRSQIGTAGEVLYSKPKSTIQLWDGHLARHRLEARTTKLDNEIGLL